jgi:hypothetical protein
VARQVMHARSDQSTRHVGQETGSIESVLFGDESPRNHHENEAGEGERSPFAVTGESLNADRVHPTGGRRNSGNCELTPVREFGGSMDAPHPDRYESRTGHRDHTSQHDEPPSWSGSPRPGVGRGTAGPLTARGGWVRGRHAHELRYHDGTTPITTPSQRRPNPGANSSLSNIAGVGKVWVTPARRVETSCGVVVMFPFAGHNRCFLSFSLANEWPNGQSECRSPRSTCRHRRIRKETVVEG